MTEGADVHVNQRFGLPNGPLDQEPRRGVANEEDGGRVDPEGPWQANFLDELFEGKGKDYSAHSSS